MRGKISRQGLAPACCARRSGPRSIRGGRTSAAARRRRSARESVTVSARTFSATATSAATTRPRPVERVEQAEPGGEPEEVRAAVPEHRPLARIPRQQRARRAERHRRAGTGRAATRRRSTATATGQEELHRAARADVEAVPQVRARGDEHDRRLPGRGPSEPAPRRRPPPTAAGDDHELHDARRDPAVRQRAEVGREPAGSRRGEVVHEPRPRDEPERRRSPPTPRAGPRRRPATATTRAAIAPAATTKSPSVAGTSTPRWFAHAQATDHRSPIARGRAARTMSNPCFPRWRNPGMSSEVARCSSAAGTSTTRSPARTASIVIAVSTPNPRASGRTAASASAVSARWPDSGSAGRYPHRSRIARAGEPLHEAEPARSRRREHRDREVRLARRHGFEHPGEGRGRSAEVAVGEEPDVGGRESRASAPSSAPPLPRGRRQSAAPSRRPRGPRPRWRRANRRRPRRPRPPPGSLAEPRRSRRSGRPRPARPRAPRPGSRQRRAADRRRPSHRRRRRRRCEGAPRAPATSAAPPACQVEIVDGHDAGVAVIAHERDEGQLGEQRLPRGHRRPEVVQGQHERDREVGGVDQDPRTPRLRREPRRPGPARRYRRARPATRRGPPVPAPGIRPRAARRARRPRRSEVAGRVVSREASDGRDLGRVHRPRPRRAEDRRRAPPARPDPPTRACRSAEIVATTLGPADRERLHRFRQHGILDPVLRHDHRGVAEQDVATRGAAASPRRRRRARRPRLASRSGLAPGPRVRFSRSSVRLWS